MGEKITAEDILPLLKKVKRSGRGYTACCPAHEDRRPSLSIANGDRGLMLHCFTGCSIGSIRAALGIQHTPYVPFVAKPKIVRTSEPSVNFRPIFQKWSNETDGYFLDGFAMSLGVSTEALQSIGCGWADREWADREKRRDATPGWAFPMYDQHKNVIGLRIRAMDGSKWAMPRSRNGLFIPREVEHDDVAWIVEGPTDAAAALTIGLHPIGRPSCSACDDMVIAYLKRNRFRRAVIITDNDQPDKHGVIAGLRGARKLQNALPVKSCMWVVPTKDLRDFVTQGGDRDLIESSIRDIVWKAA